MSNNIKYESKEADKKNRKRGDQLIESIYDATLNILRAEGYNNLTFAKIADIAQTSRTVLYRRWPSPFALVRDIMIYKSKKAIGGDLIDKIKDTGSLRGDLLYMLKLYQNIYLETGPEIMNAMLFEMSQRNVKIPVIKDDIWHRNVIYMSKIIQFAEARGEKIKKLSPVALTLPFDLVRMSFMWEQRVLDKKAREQLVDEILLPVYVDMSK